LQRYFSVVKVLQCYKGVTVVYRRCCSVAVLQRCYSVAKVLQCCRGVTVL